MNYFHLVSTRICFIISWRNEYNNCDGISRCTSSSFKVDLKKNFFSLAFLCLNFSVKTDTKWLSWLAYQFHIIASKNQMDDTMDLQTFKTGFYFKVVCIL